MAVFSNFEKQVVDLLTEGSLSRGLRSRLNDEATRVDLRVSGTGYFLTVRHDDLPVERAVFDQPLLVGEADEILTGFIIFVENHELTIECHSWGGCDVPKGYRDLDVQITS
ncbi:hypothetical protein [Thalassovita aquimarina]|uniref:hypothetical protein n=1 Tax=Thalassovita aquimarina TaxID=2785917 RepID=UPI0035680A26